MFKVGDRVRITTNGKTGTIKAVYDADYWNLQAGNGDHEYTVELDHGEGAINMVERVLAYEYERRCECGVKYDRHGGKHSDYCPLSNDN